MEPHEHCNQSCLAGPRPKLLKPLAEDSQFCRKGGILKAILLFLFAKIGSWVEEEERFSVSLGWVELQNSLLQCWTPEKHLRNAQSTRQISIGACISLVRKENLCWSTWYRVPAPNLLGSVGSRAVFSSRCPERGGPSASLFPSLPPSYEPQHHPRRVLIGHFHDRSQPTSPTENHPFAFFWASEQSQALGESDKTRCPCGGACGWEQGSGRESVFLYRTSKDKQLSLGSCSVWGRGEGEVGSQLETVRTVHCAFAYRKCLLSSTWDCLRIDCLLMMVKVHLKARN